MTTEQLRAEREKLAREIKRMAYVCCAFWAVMLLILLPFPKLFGPHWACMLALVAYVSSIIGVMAALGSIVQEMHTKTWFIDLILSEKTDASSPVMTPPETSK